MINRVFVRGALTLLASLCLAGGAWAQHERWEPNIAAFEARDRENPPEPGGIVFVGSSTIVGWKVKEAFPDLPVINRGFGGSQYADSAHFAPRIVIPYRPKVVVFYAGDNDISSGKSPEQCRDDVVDLVRVIREALPETRLIWVPIKACGSRWAHRARQARANRLIAEYLAGQWDTAWFDMDAIVINDEGGPRDELFLADRLHFNQAGYDQLNEALRPLLDAAYHSTSIAD